MRQQQIIQIPGAIANKYSRMQIGIFEIDHFECAYPLIKLFDNGKNQITIFAYEQSFTQLKYLLKDTVTKYDWVIKRPSESKYLFIYRIYKTAREKRFDIFYLDTIADNHLVYAMMIARLHNSRIITTLHNFNGYFSFKPALSIRRWVRYIGKRTLINTVTEFNVLSSTMIDNLKQKLPAYKTIHCIPGSIFEESNRPAPRWNIISPIKIVVSGTIDTRRRNYDFVFDMLSKINKKGIAVVVVLLGGTNIHGKPVIAKCKEYVSRYSNLQFFETDVVDQPVFDRELDEAHFILMPSVINTVISDGIQDTYGLSISSGNVFDVIRHAKPFIVPNNLEIPKGLQTSCFKYSTADDVIAFLESFLVRPEKYSEWTERALDNSRAYTIEKIRNQNPTLFM